MNIRNILAKLNTNKASETDNTLDVVLRKSVNEPTLNLTLFNHPYDDRTFSIPLPL